MPFDVEGGGHKDKCGFHFVNLRDALRAKLAHRESMEAKLPPNNADTSAAREGPRASLWPGRGHDNGKQQ